MYQHFNISTEEGNRAKWPHEIFLINLIFNHIFVFCATIAVIGSFPLLTALVPIISFAIIGYILVKAKQVAASDDSWFVKAHWQIGAMRNRYFMLLLTIACVISVGGFWLSRMLGWAKIPTIALIGGVGLLPFMVVLLVLIVLGNESVFMARDGKLPNGYGRNATTVDDETFHARFPLPNPLPMPSPQSSPANGRGGERERQSSIHAGEGANESLRELQVNRFAEQNPDVQAQPSRPAQK